MRREAATECRGAGRGLRNSSPSRISATLCSGALSTSSYVARFNARRSAGTGRVQSMPPPETAARFRSPVIIHLQRGRSCHGEWTAKVRSGRRRSGQVRREGNDPPARGPGRPRPRRPRLRHHVPARSRCGHRQDDRPGQPRPSPGQGRACHPRPHRRHHLYREGGRRAEAAAARGHRGSARTRQGRRGTRAPQNGRHRPGARAGLDPGFQVAAEIAGERVLDDAWDAWFDARMAEADDALLRALTLGLKIEDLRKAAVAMAAQRDVLGPPVARPPFDAESLRDRLREAVATLEPLKSRCTNTEDDAYQQIERLAAFHERAERADGLALERLSRELFVNAHKGQQGNWSLREACRDVKAELKALKDAQERYERDSNADLAWALRDRLRGFLDGYEALKRERALVDFADLLLKARDVLTHEVAVRRYFQQRFDFVHVDEFQDTDPLQAQIAFLLAEDPKAGPAARDWRG